MKTGKLNTFDPKEHVFIQRVVDKICEANTLPQLEVHVVRNNEPNAFVTLGNARFLFLLNMN